MLNLGVQVSIAGKIYNAVDRAIGLGCNVFQIFARNPRSFRRGNISKEDVRIFQRKVKEGKINLFIVHSPYTLNLASARYFLHKISIKEFIEDVKEADILGARFIVVHTGNFKGNKEIGLKKVAEALSLVLKNTSKTNIMILLENTSGKGGDLGDKIYHFRLILKELDYNKRIGICIDTAHSWGAGYKLNTSSGLNSFLMEIDQEVGMERLKVIHLNDTPVELGSRKDRHFAIGKGRIGEDGFKYILHHPKLKKLPFILETPKKKDLDDIINLSIVRRLYNDGL